MLIERQRHRWRARSTLAFMLIAPCLLYTYDATSRRQRQMCIRDRTATVGIRLRGPRLIYVSLNKVKQRGAFTRHLVTRSIVSLLFFQL